MATVRNMEGGRWDRNRILTLLAATLLLAVVAYWGVTLSAVAPTAAASETHAEATARPLFDAVASLPLVRLLSPVRCRPRWSCWALWPATTRRWRCFPWMAVLPKPTRRASGWGPARFSPASAPTRWN